MQFISSMKMNIYLLNSQMILVIGEEIFQKEDLSFYPNNKRRTQLSLQKQSINMTSLHHAINRSG